MVEKGVTLPDPRGRGHRPRGLSRERSGIILKPRCDYMSTGHRDGSQLMAARLRFGAGAALFVSSAQICPTTYTFAAMPNRRKVSSGGIVPSVSMIGQAVWQGPSQSAVEYST